MKLVNIGYGSMVSAERIIAVVSPDSAPVKRIITESRDKGMLIDATYGKKTKSVIVTDCNYVILSSILPKGISIRLDKDADTEN